jgi:hypothetical protein
VLIGTGTSAFTVKTNPSSAFVGTTDTQTLENKTLFVPVLSATASGTVAGRLGYLSGAFSYGDGTFQRTVVNTNESQTLINKTIAFGSNTLTDVAGVTATQTLTNKTLTTPSLSGTASGSAAGRLGYLSGAFTYGDGTFQRTVVSTDQSQTLTNKTIAFGSNTLTDVAGVTATQTLTNKTLTSPRLNGAPLSTAQGTLGISFSVLQYGDGSTTRTVVDESLSQTITNKTLSTGSTWSGNAIGATSGGTGQTTYTTGDILFASGSTALSKLADVATGSALISGGVGVAPSWGKIGLSTHVSGTLAVGNGGTGLTTPGTSGNVLTSNGSAWTSSPPNSFSAIASGSITAGNRIVINTAGTVSAAGFSSPTSGATTAIGASTASVYAVAYDPVVKRVVAVYGDGFTVFAVVGTVSGTTVSYGTPVTVHTFSGSGPNGAAAVYDPVQQRIVIACSAGATNGARIIAGQVSTSTITFGTAVDFAATGAAYGPGLAYDSVNNKTILSWGNASTGGSAVVCTLTGSSISLGTSVKFRTDPSFPMALTSAAFDPNNGVAIASVSPTGNAQIVAGTVSGTSISFGTGVSLLASNADNPTVAYDQSAQRIVASYRSSSSGFALARVAQLSGTSITLGTEVTYVSSATSSPSVVYSAALGRCVFVTNRSSGGFQTSFVIGTVTASTNSISFGTIFNLTTGISNATPIRATYDSDTATVPIIFNDNSTFLPYSALILPGSSNLTASNYIGIAATSNGGGGSVLVRVVGAVVSNQSGLTTGAIHYVQPDGTLSTTPGTPVVFAGTAVSSTSLIVKG